MLDVVIGDSLFDETTINLKDTITISFNQICDKYNGENYTFYCLLGKKRKFNVNMNHCL